MATPSSLEHQISRLGQRLERWQALSRRYSWLRLGLFVFGGLATGVAAVLGDAPNLSPAAATERTTNGFQPTRVRLRFPRAAET